jgi:hypothetical protein
LHDRRLKECALYSTRSSTNVDDIAVPLLFPRGGPQTKVRLFFLNLPPTHGHHPRIIACQTYKPHASALPY